jgi:SulP family sulfate permease
MVYVPLPVLAALLLVVAWNMAEVHRFKQLLRAPLGDRSVLLVTFALTVAVDLTIAIEVGVVLAALVFMHRMGESVSVQSLTDTGDDEEDLHIRERLPAGVEMCRFRGPLFFAVADRLDRILDPIREPPRVFILRMRQVPLVDASGVTALEAFLDRCQRMGAAVILSGLEGQPRQILRQMDFGRHPNLLGLASSFDEALAMAASALMLQPAEERGGA